MQQGNRLIGKQFHRSRLADERFKNLGIRRIFLNIQHSQLIRRIRKVIVQFKSFFTVPLFFIRRFSRCNHPVIFKTCQFLRIFLIELHNFLIRQRTENRISVSVLHFSQLRQIHSSNLLIKRFRFQCAIQLVILFSVSLNQFRDLVGRILSGIFPQQLRHFFPRSDRRVRFHLQKFAGLRVELRQDTVQRLVRTQLSQSQIRFIRTVRRSDTRNMETFQ